MSDTTVWELDIDWPVAPGMGRGGAKLRFTGTPQQARTIMDCAEAQGFFFISLGRIDAMPPEAAVQQLTGELRAIKDIQQPTKLPLPASPQPLSEEVK